VVADFLPVTCGRLLLRLVQFGSRAILLEYVFYYLIGTLMLRPARIVPVSVVAVVHEYHPVRFFLLFKLSSAKESIT